MLAFTNVAGWIILLLHCQDQPCTIPQPHRISHRGRVLLSGGGVGIFPPSRDGLWLHFVPRNCMNAEVNEESNVRNSVTFLSSVSLQNVPSPLDR